MSTADVLLLNCRVITLDPTKPCAEAVAIEGERVLAVGAEAELRALAGPDTELLDAEGGVAVPAFHDAHLHLLSYARSLSKLDCRTARSVEQLQVLIGQRVRQLPSGCWIHATGYDDARLAERRHPDRHDLDAVAPDHPVRLQHRSLHLDVLNTAAMWRTGLISPHIREVERDLEDDQPTGRLYHGAELLRRCIERADASEIRRDARAVTQRLLAWGVTTVQDASYTNDAESWELLQSLSERGDLGLRVFMMPGEPYAHEVLAASPESALVRLGPIKVMLDEKTSDPADVAAAVMEVRRIGRPVAIHATSEAEVAMALDALHRAGPGTASQPDRIEHGAVIPDALIPDLQSTGVTVVGQPSLVFERGDVYQSEYLPELHAWLHRARSLLDNHVPYAAGSDAPVTEPCPGLGMYAVQHRVTRYGGSTLSSAEALAFPEALAAFTLGPAEAVGAASDLGRIRGGALADIAVLDPDLLQPAPADAITRPTRLTVRAGKLLWRR